MLSAMLYDGEAPIVLTGANRPANTPGADGPANLLDAVALAGSARPPAWGGGRLRGRDPRRDDRAQGRQHRARGIRVPGGGPIGRVVEGRVWLHARPVRPSAVTPAPRSSGGDRHHISGRRRSHARRRPRLADGLVLVALGAGHLPPGVLQPPCGRRRARCRCWVTCRPVRPRSCSRTYGFAGPSPTCAQRCGLACRSCPPAAAAGGAAVLPGRGRSRSEGGAGGAGAMGR